MYAEVRLKPGPAEVLPIVTHLLPMVLPFKLLIINDVADVTDFSLFHAIS